MKFSEMNKEGLRKARHDLEKVMYEPLGVTRVTGLTDNGVFLEGGTFPATYDHTTRTLTIWGRGARNAGGSMTIAELKKAEDAVVAWFLTYPNREEEE